MQILLLTPCKGLIRNQPNHFIQGVPLHLHMVLFFLARQVIILVIAACVYNIILIQLRIVQTGAIFGNRAQLTHPITGTTGFLIYLPPERGKNILSVLHPVYILIILLKDKYSLYVPYGGIGQTVVFF